MENEIIARRILIVEDESLLAEMMSFTITRHGFEIKTVYSGKEALETLGKEKFDLVLLDILLPDKGGLEILREMRSGNDNTPVIILSNISDEEIIKRAKELGAKEFLTKSNTPILDLIDRIKTHLN